MIAHAPIPQPVIRAREIHRQVRIPRISEALDIHLTPATSKSKQTFEKIRAGLALRLRK